MIQTFGYLFRGILIGLIFGIPIGAVGTTTVQRTIKYGARAGLITGLGSSVADGIYASIGAFGLTFISDFLTEYQKIITLFGGVFILFMGITAIRKNQDSDIVTKKEEKDCQPVKMFGTSFIIGITNPAAILTFLFAFTYFGIGNITKAAEAVAVVVGVFIGTFCWWSILSVGTEAAVRKSKIGQFHYLNQVFGGLLLLFGLIVLYQAIW